MSGLTPPRRQVLVLGTNPAAEVLVDMFECLPGISFAGFVENRDRSRCAAPLAGLPVHWSDDIDALAESHALTCSLGTTRRRDWIEERAAKGFGFVTLVHPSSVVSARTELGEGVVVDALCVIAGYSRLGPHARVGRRASIGHHTTIGAFSTIHPAPLSRGIAGSGNRRSSAPARC